MVVDKSAWIKGWKQRLVTEDRNELAFTSG